MYSLVMALQKTRQRPKNGRKKQERKDTLLLFHGFIFGKP
jgi:hypothetical protein